MMNVSSSWIGLLATVVALTCSGIAVKAQNVNCNKCVGSGDISNNAITTRKILNGAVTTQKIGDGAVTLEKLHRKTKPASNFGVETVNFNYVELTPINTDIVVKQLEVNLPEKGFVRVSASWNYDMAEKFTDVVCTVARNPNAISTGVPLRNANSFGNPVFWVDGSLSRVFYVGAGRKKFYLICTSDTEDARIYDPELNASYAPQHYKSTSAANFSEPLPASNRTSTLSELAKKRRRRK